MTGVGLSAEAIRAPLEAFIARESGARSVCIAALTRLGGGAVQENWRLDAVIDGEAVALVMRTSSATEGVEESLSRADEFALLRAARSAGVTVPEPLWLCTERSVIGRPFHVMRIAPGVSAGHRLVKDPRVGDALAGRLGRELARIHAIRPPRSDLAFLRAPSPTPVQQAIARMRRWLDGHRVPDPALEWALRWLERNEPPCPTLTLVHGDFRTGNYLVADGELTAILDWEFSAWGDPREDIGWFCARCWRFGAVGREAGGIGSRAAFYRAPAGRAPSLGGRSLARAGAYCTDRAGAPARVAASHPRDRARRCPCVTVRRRRISSTSPARSCSRKSCRRCRRRSAMTA